MTINKWGVVKVGGVEPERFLVVGMDSDLPPGKAFMKTGNPMSEDDIRKKLEKAGVSKSEIDALILKARENPC